MELKSGKEWPLNTAYNGDNIDFMESLNDNVIDLTVTSPPYDNLRTYNDSLEWGEHIWKPILQELFRITKDGGVVVWVVADATIKGSETGTSFKQALYAMECGFNLHDTMIWSKGTPQFHDKTRYSQGFEYMFIFSKGELKTFNPIIDRRNKSYGRTRIGTDRHPDGSTTKSKDRKVKKYSQRLNIWDKVSEKGKVREIHPAVFPVSLCFDHIISWSNKNDLVFDPFMGSFTTAIAAHNLQRNWLGCEKDPDYFKAGQERYETECLQNLLSFT